MWQFPLLGWSALFGILTLMLSTAMLEAGLTVGIVAFSGVVNVIYFLLALFNIGYVGYLVFGTDGAGHYQLRLWHAFDAFLGEMLGQLALSMVLWMGAAANSNFAMFSHTGDRNPFYALYDQAIYIFCMLTGGGVVDNAPLGEPARLMLAVHLTLHTFTLIIVLSALVATLTTHTDEAAKLRSDS